MLGKQFEVLAVFKVVDNLTKPIDEMQKAMTGFRKSIEGVREGLDKIQNAGKKMAAMGTAITAPFAGATYLAMNFDKAMNEASTLVDMSLQEFRRKYDRQILNLAKELGQSPEQVARAFYQAISSGLDPDKAISFLRQAGKAAIAGVSDIFTATDGLTTALNAWKEFGYTVGQMSDYMFLAVKAGKTTFREIAASIGNVAPIAAKAGVSVQEVLAAMATATTQGATTSEAFNGIRAAIESIMNPTSQAEKWFEKLGVQIDANTLKQKGLKGTLEILSNAIRGYTNDEAEQKKILAEIFGQVEGLNQVFAITGSGGKKFAEILQMMGKSAGATDKAFKKMAQSASFQFSQMKTSLQVLGISIGTLLLPPLNAMLKTISAAIKPVIDFVQAHKTLAKVLVYPVVGIGVLLTVLGSLMATIGFVGQGILSFVEFMPVLTSGLSTVTSAVVGFSTTLITGLISALTTAITTILSFSATLITGLVSALTAATSAVISFTTALLANPITWVVAGIAALVAAGYYLYKNWDTVSNYIKGIWQGVKEFFVSVFEGIKGIFQGVVSFFSAAWQKFVSIFLWTNPITAPIMALKKLHNFAKSINLFEAGRQIIEGLWKGLASMAKKPLEAIENIGHSIKERFKSILGISSPSKLFMEFGHFLNEGLGIGMLKSIGVVQDAVKRITSVLHLPEDKRLRIALETATKGGLPAVAGILTAGMMPAVGNSYQPINISITISSLVVSDKNDASIVAKEITGLTKAELERMLREIHEQQQRKRY
ncbi:phage tail tape measure protein [Desulfurobacterium indicum]|uniref:Phage tail tape measure protein n=1 Tax=Desulfurobacterium indicum TaxID=1914305 RepID=A0A1R1MK84_9BACT|nr:phage tail tape measure protein [Desulfurobacterium indicum]OMH40217.1 phage tail tape measure protein [Desulfurobacterium indicum]